jgi:hypothetical protein
VDVAAVPVRAAHNPPPEGFGKSHCLLCQVLLDYRSLAE